MSRFFIFSFLILVSCGQHGNEEQEIELTKKEISELLSDWKRDSLGCLRVRDSEKMNIYAQQLIGKDSVELFSDLGYPNFRYGEPDKRHFYYTLECPEDRPSYYNFYFHFNGDTIESFSNPIIN